MRYTFFVQSITYSAISTIIIVALLNVSSAQIRTSSNYQLQSDSINIGGGLASSTSYTQESTIGEIATGPSDSTTYSLRAGYQQMQEVFLSLALSSGEVAMSPDLPGITGGTSNGSTTLTVITDSPSGYQLTIQAENNPAMQSPAHSIDDYNAGAIPDFSFVTGSSQSHFGYTPEGVDVTQEFLDNGGTCGVGTQDTTLACWDGMSTAARAIAEGAGSNHPAGATTTVHFRVGLGGSAGVSPGVYTATTTVTALPL